MQHQCRLFVYEQACLAAGTGLQKGAGREEVKRCDALNLQERKFRLKHIEQSKAPRAGLPRRSHHGKTDDDLSDLTTLQHAGPRTRDDDMLRHNQRCRQRGVMLLLRVRESGVDARF